MTLNVLSSNWNVIQKHLPNSRVTNKRLTLHKMDTDCMFLNFLMVSKASRAIEINACRL